MLGHWDIHPGPVPFKPLALAGTLAFLKKKREDFATVTITPPDRLGTITTHFQPHHVGADAAADWWSGCKNMPKHWRFAIGMARLLDTSNFQVVGSPLGLISSKCKQLCIYWIPKKLAPDSPNVDIIFLSCQIGEKGWLRSRPEIHRKKEPMNQSIDQQNVQPLKQAALIALALVALYYVYHH